MTVILYIIVLHALRTRRQLCFILSPLFRGRDETNSGLWGWSSF